jgi:hypothetical protein
MYLPQFFLENAAVVQLCTDRINYRTTQQYQDEERTLINRRILLAHSRLSAFWEAMLGEEIAPEENVIRLREELNQYHDCDSFSRCESMGWLVKRNLEISLAKTSSEQR